MCKKLLAFLLLVSLFNPGCGCLNYLMYTLAISPPAKTVLPEYEGLKGQTVAIVIYATPKVLYEYSAVAEELSTNISDELRQKVKGAKVIAPYRVLKYQQENLFWDQEPRTDLGKQFGADYVLFVSLIEYSLREPGSIQLFRGQIVAEASLYKTSLPAVQARVWRAADLRVTFPENAPVGRPLEDNRNIGFVTQKLFAIKLVKSFYKHKVEVQEGEVS